MATITGLTAERMLAIEAASVVDGDVVGDNLILTQRDGTQINAGSVRGPVGAAGPVGQDLLAISAAPILDVGQTGQIRAGRQLTAADFTNMGLSVPIGLWNLSSLADSSGNGRNLLNKGAVPLTAGINGLANTAAMFKGADQALYISDTGAGDPFRIKTGSFGAWFRTAKRGTAQNVMGRVTPTPQYFLQLGGNNLLNVGISIDGAAYVSVQGTTDICNDLWHFCVCTYDGVVIRAYTDGILDGVSAGPGGNIINGPSPVNIGALAADAATAASNPMYGPVDEAFVTADILSEDQIRNLYCAKIPHTLGIMPTRINLNVRRRRRGAALSVADFPAQPLRLHNFSAGSLGDEGSSGTALLNNGGAVSSPGVDGSAGNAFSFAGAQSLSSSDAGLPAGIVTRSYGCWFKTNLHTGCGVIGWGGTLNVADIKMYVQNASGSLISACGGDVISTFRVDDGAWHFAVTVEDNTAIDGVRRKCYVDGRLAGASLTLPAGTTSGTTNLRLGNYPDGTPGFLYGLMDTAFVCGYALTARDILKLYAKGAQALALSPKNAGDHVEALNTTDILATFDSLSSQHLIDLMVAA